MTIYPLVKRTFDTLFAAAGLAVLSPVLGAIAIAIRAGSSGPLLYRGRRVGLNGELFDMLKFRTMVENADQIGGSSTPADDRRVTGIGRTLRRYKLDELPQLWNVLSGDMSFVGPRPQVQWAVDLYTPEERAILSVRPGITDEASLKFSNEAEILRGSADPDKDYIEKIHPEKMRLSLAYVGDRSFFGDLSIIARTAGAIIRPLRQ